MTDVGPPRTDIPLVVRPWEALIEQKGWALDLACVTRHGGVSSSPYDTANVSFAVGDDPEHVVENRRKVARAWGRPLDEMVFVRQVHSHDIMVVDEHHAGAGSSTWDSALGPADGMVIARTNVTLVILMADCLPVAVYDPTAHLLGVAHAGWRGLAWGVLPAMAQQLVALGCDLTRCHAFFGPSISPGRYEVGWDVVEALEATGVTPSAWGGRSSRNLPLVNLLAVATQQVEGLGIATGNCHPLPARYGDDMWFSDRAARPCGRNAFLARLC